MKSQNNEPNQINKPKWTYDSKSPFHEVSYRIYQIVRKVSNEISLRKKCLTSSFVQLFIFKCSHNLLTSIFSYYFIRCNLHKINYRNVLGIALYTIVKPNINHYKVSLFNTKELPIKNSQLCSERKCLLLNAAKYWMSIIKHLTDFCQMIKEWL